MPLRIGTSGWNYPSGKGTWNGIFYPAPGTRPSRFDELTFYAERFNTVRSIRRSTASPAPRSARPGSRRTPPGFEFAVKLYQKFTHPNFATDKIAGPA